MTCTVQKYSHHFLKALIFEAQLFIYAFICSDFVNMKGSKQYQNALQTAEDDN